MNQETQLRAPARQPTLIIVVALLLIPTLLAWQCQERGATVPGAPSDDGDPRDSRSVPNDFRLSLGTGGGFTGEWNGYDITSDGTVTAWTNRGTTSDSTLAGSLPPDSLLLILEELERAAFYTDNTQDPGNITAFLEIRADGDAHRVTWRPTLESVDPPQSPTEAVYRRITRMIASITD